MNSGTSMLTALAAGFAVGVSPKLRGAAVAHHQEDDLIRSHCRYR